MTTTVRTGELRGNSFNGKDLSTPQKLMIFVLSMSLFGLSNILVEVIPEFTIGPVEIALAYFVFIPLVLAALFNPFWVALGAPLGEIIFTDLLLGDFSGIGEIEGFIQMFLAIYIAGSLIRNSLSKAQVAFGAIMIVVIDKFLSAIVDLSKVWFGLEDAEFVEGLPESMLLIEVIGFGVDILLSGIVFGVIPALWLVPKLYGRIEPLMGMQPRQPGKPIQGSTPGIGITVALVFVLGAASAVFAFLEAWGADFGAAEWEWLDTYGPAILLVPAAIFVVLLAGVFVFAGKQRKQP